MFVFIFVLYIVYLQFSLDLQQFLKIYTALQSFFHKSFKYTAFILNIWLTSVQLIIWL